jgi:hypothetical protein
MLASMLYKSVLLDNLLTLITVNVADDYERVEDVVAWQSASGAHRFSANSTVVSSVAEFTLMNLGKAVIHLRRQFSIILVLCNFGPQIVEYNAYVDENKYIDDVERYAMQE